MRFKDTNSQIAKWNDKKLVGGAKSIMKSLNSWLHQEKRSGITIQPR
jgi:hypothetical protein